MKKIFLLLLLPFLFQACSEEKGAVAKLGENITFTEHIAPIIHAHCTSCHRPGQAGPFPLRSYEEVSKHARMIYYVTAEKIMPPWPADREYRHFSQERGLSENELALIKKWYELEWPEGPKDQMPDLPTFPSASQLGKPDLVLKMKEAHLIKGNAQDEFLSMKIPFEIPQDTFVRLIEFVPGNREVVHHVNAHIINYNFNNKKNIYEGVNSVDAYHFDERKDLYEHLGLLQDDGTYPEVIPLVCNYLPGVIPQFYPEGMGGFPINKKGALVLNDIHYGPSGIDTTDQSYFNIFFDKGPPKRPTYELQMGTLGISDIVPPLIIPPDTIMTFKTKAKVLGDVSLLTVNPHMHLLGKNFWAYAITPKKDTIPLIKIPKWDFRWQYFYTYKNPVHLPKDTYIYVEASFDNSKENPNNPYDPPRVIAERSGSMRTTDEMLQFIMTFTPYQKGDEAISLEVY